MKLLCKCDWCGKEFEREKKAIKKRNFCSRSCLGKSNGARLKKEIYKTCDNCGRIFLYRSKHSGRNKHDFCSKECAYAYKVKKVKVKCDWCGKEFIKKRSDVARNNLNFCDRDCYLDFINLERAGAKNQVVMGTVVHRTLAEMKIGRPLVKGEEVHHIDGNHMNNSLNNLMVVTASEHSKIHAAMKARDVRGRFIKKD